jgi:hypothetical protein
MQPCGILNCGAELGGPSTACARSSGRIELNIGYSTKTTTLYEVSMVQKPQKYDRRSKAKYMNPDRSTVKGSGT